MADLKPIHLKVIRTLLCNRRNSATLNEAWRYIHETLEVGEPRGNSLHFDAAMLRILRREAERESGAENLLAYDPSGNRLQAARQGLIDEKVAPQRPDDGFVLVKGRLPAPLPGLTPELSLRVPLASLVLYRGHGGLVRDGQRHRLRRLGPGGSGDRHDAPRRWGSVGTGAGRGLADQGQQGGLRWSAQGYPLSGRCEAGRLARCLGGDEGGRGQPQAAAYAGLWCPFAAGHAHYLRRTYSSTFVLSRRPGRTNVQLYFRSVSAPGQRSRLAFPLGLSHSSMHLLYTILIMLLVVGGTRITAQFVPIPLPLIQIAMGALLALPGFGLHVRLDPELFLLLFIPPLLFVDGWRMPKGEFRRLRTPILLLAFGLVLFTVLGAGWLIHLLLPQLPLAAAFALAAVLSPTDAVAVSAITHGRLPRTLMNILQGEALMNDASGLVAFKFAVIAALTGVFSLAEASVNFVLVALGGLAVGTALGYALGHFRAWMIGLGWEDPAPHVMFMLLLPFAAYVAAERLGVSGILSAVAAGMLQSRLDLLPRQTTTRLLNRSVWALLEFIFNGLIFLLLGLQLPDIVKISFGEGGQLWTNAEWLSLYVGQVYLALMALRFVWTWLYGVLSGALHRWRGTPSILAGMSSLRLAALLTLSGVRGAVTLAGVLSLPLLLRSGEVFPQRNLLIFIAAGVILLSLVVASIGLPLLLRGLPADNEDARLLELQRHRAKTVEAAIRALEAQTEELGLDAEGMALAAEVKAKIMAEYRQQLASDDSGEARARLRQMEALEQRMRLQALRAQRLELYRLRHHHQVDDDLLSEILRELDISEARLYRSS